MTAGSELSSNIETEITLLVTSDDPQAFRASFVAMDRIGKYALSPADLLIIQDVYLDTPAGDLSRQSWVVRVRTENGSTYLTLKGPARRTPWGGAQRIEIEEPWSEESVERIVGTIALMGSGVVLRPVTVGDTSAVETLKRCGLVELQQRQTRRDRRNVFLATEGAPVAELVLDRVVYRFSSREIRHMEIEVEAADPSRVEQTKAVADELLALFGPALRPWNYGKMTTGKALEMLLAHGKLQGLIRPDNYLMPIVYALIELRMRKR